MFDQNNIFKYTQNKINVLKISRDTTETNTRMKYTVCCTLAFIDFKSICLIYRTPSLSPCLERDGLKGSFGIFELRASFVEMPNVPESEGMV
jgi:hypothetical protein